LKDDFVKSHYAVISVIGVGGGGCNAVNRMMEDNISGCEFIAINTDAQALMMSNADKKLLIGDSGLGAGSNPELGRISAEKSIDVIKEVVKNSDMVFITCGEGGGTGTGAAPVIAAVAKECGCLTVAVVTKPFSFEGRTRILQAEEGVKNLKGKVDTLIVIPNDKLLEVADENTTLLTAFRLADNVLKAGVRGVTDLITLPGLINLDFRDIETIIKDAGTAILGDGIASGENRAIKAAQLAIKNPLIDNSIDGAMGILLNISGGPDLKLYEVNEAAEVVRNAASSEANIIFGAVIDESLNEKIKVTIIAAGFKERDRSSVKERETAIEKPLIPEDKIKDLIEEKKPQDRFDEKPFIEQEKKEYREAAQKKVIPDVLKSMEEEDYLDIPTFLRKNNQSKF
jgi:cell division protein FtsZ